MNYYPLAAQNEWQYKQKDGSTYFNKVTGVSGNDFTMHNSAANTSSVVRKEGELLLTDALEAGNFQPWLNNDLQASQTWEVKFKANGLDCILVMTIKETGISKEVEGKTYNNIVCIEGESKLIMNGNLMALNFFTQYYYADGIGLVLTTSSAGDSHSLINYSLH
ncbi:MAG TPA: hypothetical protein VGO58_04340 [Chitinophagaceae bacterium]|jgi:hypothetical protein|nr:hypothetical protein [Chitinophagaceae bacterium]